MLVIHGFMWKTDANILEGPNLPPCLGTMSCFGQTWSQFSWIFLMFSLLSSLPLSPSLSLSLWYDWSVFWALWSYKMPLVGVETQTARSLTLRKTNCQLHTQHLWHWTFKNPSCVRDLQHFLPHAWKGKLQRWRVEDVKLYFHRWHSL